MKIKNFGYSRSKARIFRRHNRIIASGIPPSDVLHRITLLVDPDLTKTIDIARRNIRNQHEKREDNNA